MSKIMFFLCSLFLFSECISSQSSDESDDDILRAQRKGHTLHQESCGLDECPHVRLGVETWDEREGEWEECKVFFSGSYVHAYGCPLILTVAHSFRNFNPSQNRVRIFFTNGKEEVSRSLSARPIDYHDIALIFLDGHLNIKPLEIYDDQSIFTKPFDAFVHSRGAPIFEYDQGIMGYHAFPHRKILSDLRDNLEKERNLIKEKSLETVNLESEDCHDFESRIEEIRREINSLYNREILCYMETQERYINYNNFIIDKNSYKIKFPVDKNNNMSSASPGFSGSGLTTQDGKIVGVLGCGSEYTTRKFVFKCFSEKILRGQLKEAWSDFMCFKRESKENGLLIFMPSRENRFSFVDPIWIRQKIYEKGTGTLKTYETLKKKPGDVKRRVFHSLWTGEWKKWLSRSS